MNRPGNGHGSLRILVADGPGAVRGGITDILSGNGVLVVGRATDGGDACRLAAAVDPDVLVLDVGLPGQDVRRTLAEFRRVAPRCGIVALTAQDGAAVSAWELLSLGASACLVNGPTRAEVLAAVHGAASGRVMLSFSRRRHGSPAVPRGRGLSAREREILTLTSLALSNAQIARKLSIAEGTVKRHLGNIFRKLGAVSRMDAVNKAVAAFLIPLPPALPGTGHVPSRLYVADPLPQTVAPCRVPHLR
ncbi:response regulator transcription factor [Streptomyces sp. YIM 98790]|uniref:LuxR C-terminal-related transcriptional regulator n=1 Tax=Streptomyces sp. YIM 98790 TaxID=2689077 RepID=UPI00140B1929|nr:response regulator transcription factor [Streptomyces sp. YIM 98790]